MYFDGCSRIKVVIEKTEMAEVFGKLHVNRFLKNNGISNVQLFRNW